MYRAVCWVSGTRKPGFAAVWGPHSSQGSKSPQFRKITVSDLGQVGSAPEPGATRTSAQRGWALTRETGPGVLEARGSRHSGGRGRGWGLRLAGLMERRGRRWGERTQRSQNALPQDLNTGLGPRCWRRISEVADVSHLRRFFSQLNHRGRPGCGSHPDGRSLRGQLLP